jgi:hypothetical protein
MVSVSDVNFSQERVDLLFETLVDVFIETVNKGPTVVVPENVFLDNTLMSKLFCFGFENIKEGVSPDAIGLLMESEVDILFEQKRKSFQDVLESRIMTQVMRFMQTSEVRALCGLIDSFCSPEVCGKLAKRLDYDTSNYTGS